jgi:hypothetical protein
MSPYVSHPLLAVVDSLILIGLSALIFRLTGIETIPAWLFAIIVPCIAVSAVYYGREAGQREHDLKHTVPPHSQLVAFFGGKYPILWTGENWLQWLVAVAGAVVLAAVLIILHFNAA